jgi:hypothetical protein
MPYVSLVDWDELKKQANERRIEADMQKCRLYAQAINEAMDSYILAIKPIYPLERRKKRVWGRRLCK